MISLGWEDCGKLAWNRIWTCRKADNRMNELMEDDFSGMGRRALCLLVFSVHWWMHTQVYSHYTSQLLCDISGVHFIMDGYLKRPHDNEKVERGDEKSTRRNDKWETWLFRDSQALYSQSKPTIYIHDFIAFITVKLHDYFCNRIVGIQQQTEMAVWDLRLSLVYWRRQWRLGSNYQHFEKRKAYKTS
jgi:hypothetical protein